MKIFFIFRKRNEIVSYAIFVKSFSKVSHQFISHFENEDETLFVITKLSIPEKVFKKPISRSFTNFEMHPSFLEY